MPIGTKSRLTERWVTTGDALIGDAVAEIARLERLLNALVEVCDPIEHKRRPAAKNAEAVLAKLARRRTR